MSKPRDERQKDLLKPALEEAAREMENSHDDHGGDSQGDEGPAVARLKMILRHMRA